MNGEQAQTTRSPTVESEWIARVSRLVLRQNPLWNGNIKRWQKYIIGGKKVADTNEIYFITWNSCCRIFVRYLLRNDRNDYRVNRDIFSYYDQLRYDLIIDLLWKVLFLNIDLLWKLLFLNIDLLWKILFLSIDIIFIVCEVYGFLWSFYTVMNYGQIKWINDNCQIVYRKDTVLKRRLLKKYKIEENKVFHVTLELFWKETEFIFGSFEQF